MPFLLAGYDQMCTEVNKINAGNSRVMQMSTEVDKINRLNSKVLLAMYVETLTFLSSTCVDIMEESNWLNRVFTFSFYILYGFTLIIAAEANEKVSQGIKFT